MLKRLFNKKAQMKIQQMAFMLIAVTLFFALAGLFIITILFSNVKQSAASLQEQNALLLASRLANSPEFSCGNAFGTSRVNCIDFDKAMALSSEIGKYSSFWGVSGIKLQKVYPQAENVTCTNGNYPECDTLNILTPKGGNGTGVSNFVALCNKKGDSSGIVQDECSLGRIIITYNG